MAEDHIRRFDTDDMMCLEVSYPAGHPRTDVKNLNDLLDYNDKLLSDILALFPTQWLEAELERRADRGEGA